MAINFDSIPQDKPAGNATVIPKGRYLAKVEKAEMKLGKDTTKPEYLNLTLAISDPESKTPMGLVWDIVTESQADLARYKLGRLIKALKLPIKGNFDLKDLVKMVPGREMLVDIKIDDAGQTPRSVVDATAAEIYYPIGTKTSAVPAAAAVETPPPFEAEDEDIEY